MRIVIFKTITVIISIIMMLMLAELFLRLNPKFGYIYNSARINSDISSGTLKMLNVDSSRYRPSEILGYELVPNSGPDVNSYGFIGKEYNAAKDKGTFRIFVIGDSVAEYGWASEFLENYLNSNPRLQAKHRFEVWTAACGGYDIKQYTNLLKYKVLKYKPDMIIIFFVLNDLEADMNIYYKIKQNVISYNFAIPEVSKLYIPSKLLMKDSFLYRFIILSLNNYLMERKKTQGIDYRLETGQFYLQNIKDVCGNNKIPLLSVIFPYLKPFSQYQQYQLYQYKTIEKLLREKKVCFVDLHNHLQESKLLHLRDMKDDEIHPNKEGHQLVASVIYEYLLKNSF